MANCKIHTDLDTGQISVEAPNGQPSKLFMDALELTNNQEQALEIWSVSETDNFKELITSQHENNGQAQEIEQTGVGVSEIHRRLTSFVGGYERAIRTYDAENQFGQNGERIKRESVALIDYAKESGIFINNINETFEPTELSGAESDIYLDPNNPNVIIKEFVPYSHNGYQGALGRILLQNRLFPQTAYNVIGVTQYGDYAALVLEQPFVKNARNATVEEIFQYVENIGFEITSSNVGVYTAENQDGVVLSDLHEGNLLVAPDGSMHLIDPQISYEGTTPFYQYISTIQPTSQVTTDENGEVDLSLVMSYIQASNTQTVEPMTPTEEQTVKNMLLSFEMPDSNYLNQRLQRLFPIGIFSLDSLRTSTLFNRSEKKYISESTEAQDNLLRLSQQLNNREDVIVNDLYEKQDRNFVVYSGNKNKYGTDEVKNPAQVEQDIISTVGGIRNREEFDSAFNSLPYESIIEEYNSNEEIAHDYFERYSTMHRTPVQRIENNEVVRKNETDRANTVENTATLEKVDFRDDIRFLSQVPNDVWEDSEQEVTEALTSIEAKGVTSAIDLQGLSESYSYKTQQEVIGFLATLNNLQNTPTETTLDNFIQSYREFFEVEATPSTEVQEIAEENLSKTIYKVENPATEYGMFNDHSLVKVDGSNYQKVQKQPLETMYEALYAQITRGQSRLPKRAYGDSNDKPTILGNIRNFVNGLLGGSVKIPNRVVENVNPKTQARLIAEYLKEKLGYDIKILPENTLQEEVENRQQEVLQSSRVQEEGIIRRSDLTQVADQTVQDILEYNQYYKSKQLVEQGTKRTKPREFVENSRFNTESTPMLVLGYPSEILTGVGISNLPIRVPHDYFQEHLIENISHEITAKDIAEIMRGIHNPLAIYKNQESENQSRVNRYEILTPLKNRNGDNIIVVVESDKSARIYDEVMGSTTTEDYNTVVTAFAKQNTKRLSNAIDNNNLLFINRKRIGVSYLGEENHPLVVNRNDTSNPEKRLESSYLGGSRASVVNRKEVSNLTAKIQQIFESTRNFQNFNNINEVVFLKDKNETIYGFYDTKTSEIYLSEEYLTSESLIHEMSHAYFPVIRQQAAQGNKQAQTVIDRMESTAKSLIGKNTITNRYNSKTTNSTNIQPLIISEQGANNVTKYKENLDRAKELRENGVPLSEISDQTGWYLHQGDWKMLSPEIIDEFRIKNYETDIELTLREVLGDENILFEDYPSLGEYKVVFIEEGVENAPLSIERANAAYDVRSGTIFINTRNGGVERVLQEISYSLGHEVQHIIQELENLPRGGYPNSVLNEAMRLLNVGTRVNLTELQRTIESSDLSDFSSEEVNIIQGGKKAAEALLNGDKSFLYNQYRHLVGEIDANVVEGALKIRDNQATTVSSYRDLLGYYMLNYNIDPNNVYVLRNGDIEFSAEPSIVPTADVYNPRQGESFEDYQERMIDETMAVIMQENSVEYFERIAEENGLTEQQTKSFLKQIQEFIQQFSKWISSQFGIDTVTEDMTNKELYDVVTTSMLRGDLITNSPTLREVTGGNTAFSVKEDSYDMDVAENLLLTKLYFKNPINPTPAENNVEVDRKFIESFDGDYNYLSSDYISDFQTETLRQRNNDSVLFNEVYSQFSIGESGIEPINTDNLSLENLKAAIEEHLTEKQLNDLKNYSVISKNRDIKQLFEIDPQQPTIEVMSQERIYYQNNIETLPHFAGDYQTINENSITTTEAGQNFIKVNNSLYEKSQDAASQSFYRKIPTYNEVFNVITEQQPVDKFGYEEINPYLRTTETTQTESNKYSREELETINEEFFSCNN